MGRPDSSQLIDLARTLLVIVAGLWVFYRYRTRREDKAVIRMGFAVRRGLGPAGEPGLFVRTHAANVSAVALRQVEAALEVLAPVAHRAKQARFEILATTDPLLPLIRETAVDRGRITFLPGGRFVVEPGECIESETFVALPQPALPLVALRLTLFGTALTLRRPNVQWTVFAFVALDRVNEEFCALTCHARDLPEVHSTT